MAESTEMEQIDTGDHVLHVPTGESWVVAYVENGRLACCGWPYSLAELSDCRLTERATPEKRQKLLEDLARMGGDDPRKSYAVRVLADQVAKAAESELDALKARIARDGLTSMPVREALADVQHEIWSHWMRYFFTKCNTIRPWLGEGDNQTVMVFSQSLAERWTRQMNTPYAELSEQEQKSDLDQADKVLAVLPELAALRGVHIDGDPDGAVLELLNAIEAMLDFLYIADDRAWAEACRRLEAPRARFILEAEAAKP